MILLVRSSDMRNFRFWQIRRLLDHLGIPHTSAYMASGDVNAELQTPAGSFASNSSDLRNYFRQNFQAIWVLDTGALEGGGGRLAAAHWLTWNDPEDPPVVYFGWNFDANFAALNPLIPSDFPIVRTNRTEIASAITSQTQPASAYVLEGFSPIYDLYNLRTGTAVRFVRESAVAVLPTWNWRNSTNHIGLWRLNLTQHATLADTPYTHRVALNNRAGEILVVPESQPDETFPSDVIVAYRYRNRVFLPMVYPLPEFGFLSARVQAGAGLFWVLYTLKVLNIPPARVLPLHYETDHPIQCHNRAPLDNLSYLQQLQVFTRIFEWWRGFCQETGMVVHNGALTGGMARRRTDTHPTYTPTGAGDHWVLVHATQYGLPLEVEQAAQALNALLIAGHREGTLPCGVHDHTLPGGSGGFWATATATIRRHQASDYAHLGLSFPLEAPNNIRIRRGRTCCAKHAMPAGALLTDAIEQRLGETEYYEQDFEASAYSGSAMQISNVPSGSLNAALMIVESNIAELLALGFPDGHGGEHAYTNTAGNHSGGDYYWEANRRYGYKALRTQLACNFGDGTTRNKSVNPVSINGIWKGFHLIGSADMDSVANDRFPTGLYSGLTNNNASDAVRGWDVDVSGDITSNYPATFWRAHRRVLAKMTLTWLYTSAVMLGGAYVHPTGTWFGLNLTDPTARADAGLLNPFNLPHWNPTVELMENMRVIVSVLSDYLKFGSVSDLIQVRGRAMAVW